MTEALLIWDATFIYTKFSYVPESTSGPFYSTGLSVHLGANTTQF